MTTAPATPVPTELESQHSEINPSSARRCVRCGQPIHPRKDSWKMKNQENAARHLPRRARRPDPKRPTHPPPEQSNPGRGSRVHARVPLDG